MGSDTANLPKRLIKQGITGFTALAFLLTQCAWPLLVFAQDTLRQEPIPEAAGLEEFKTKFRAKQEAAAGLEEMITLTGPNGPIQYQVPKIVKLAIEQLTAKVPTSPQTAIATLLGPRPPRERFSSLLSYQPTFFFWALEHIPDSQTPLHEEDRKPRGTPQSDWSCAG